jgi:rare lipoprotein A
MHMKRPRWAIGFLLLALPACSTPAPTPAPAAVAPAPCMQTGTASWYRPKAALKPTASGETPGSGALIAAHPTLPFGTLVTVTELASGRSVVVRIADRGPFAKGRIIDLSPAAAAKLGMRQDGVAQVRIELYQPSSSAPGAQPAALTDAACPFPKNTAA